MPLQATSGAASYDAFGGGVPVVPVYVEDVMSTWLYTGNGSTQTITNGIDESGKGAMTWIKKRNAAEDHVLTDTVRGAGNTLFSNLTDANEYDITRLSAFTSSGFSVGGSSRVNQNGNTFASWTFREQPKFFDVVTYTGNGTAGRTVAHNLGSVPGFIVVKCTSSSGAWTVYHRSTGSTKYLILNNTDAADTFTGMWNNTDPTATEFTLGASSFVNQSGQTFVAYLFAHNAGGFGLTGTDNVISCGSYSGTGSTPNDVTLGFEPQWLLVKNTTSSGQEWGMFDNMRGLVTGTDGDAQLFANASSAENVSAYFRATATGFACEDASTRYNASGNTYIYIAIRRGPMKVPTSGTSVFSPINQAGGGTVTTNFPVDLNINTAKSLTIDKYAFSRLTGPANYLNTNLTAAETAGGANFILFDRQNSIKDDFWGSGNSIIYWNFRRAPSFFDEVCYTGTGTAGQTFNHNLTVVPELIIVKSRSLSGEQWPVYASPITVLKVLQLNTTIAATTYSGYWNNTAPTSSVFSVSDTSTVNQSGATFVAYLFATCAGVSKVFSYTGNGSSQTINCGFTGGSRFVMIKRTDSAGDWYVWDSARGIVSGNDPHLSLNSTAAEVTSDDTIDTDSTGFVVNQVSATNVNVSSATYIGLAIA